MMNKISITFVRNNHASCCVCLAKNYRTEQSLPDDPSIFVQDLYDLQIGSTVLCLCPQCLSQVQFQVWQQINHRNLPEAYIIVRDPHTYAPKIVKGAKEILSNGQIRIAVKTSPLSEDVYTYPSPEDAAEYVFDDHEAAQVRLMEIKYGGAQ